MFVDEATRLIKVEVVKDKSHSVEAFTKFLTFQKNAINITPTRFHSDNGTELTNSKLEELLSSPHLQISQSFSTPYVKQQNGLAESTIRHLINTTRSLLIPSNLPRTLWGEAMKTAADLINIRYKPTINSSPYFLYHQKQPQISHLKVWGTPAYTLIPKEKRSSHMKSFGPVSRKRYFVGYTESTKIFKLYDKQNRNVDRYTNVVFLDENTSPQSKPTNNNSPEASEIENSNNSSTISNSDCPELNLFDSYEQSIVSSNQHTTTQQLTNNDQHSNSNVESTNNPTSIQPKRKYKKIKYNKVDRQLRPRILNALVALPQNDEQIGNHQLWSQARQDEMAAHHRNETWIKVVPPADSSIVQCRWVYATKLSMQGELVFKARLVAKGYTQKYGIDFFETYSPAMHIIAFRILLCFILQFDLLVLQFDVTTAFLNAPLHEKIYMAQAPGFEDGTNSVCLLRKAIYGLKQASLMWYEEITSSLIEFGFERLESESCIFKWTKQRELMLIGLFIDDGIIAATKNELIDQVVQFLNNKYQIKTCKPQRFIGMQLDINSDRIIIHQHDYIKKLLNLYNMTNCNGAKTPLPTGNPIKFDDEHDESIDYEYRSLISSLLYLSRLSRPDIAYHVGILSSKLNRPSTNDLRMGKRVLRFIKHTQHYVMIFYKNDQPNKFDLTGYSDANFNVENRGLSRSGTLAKLFNNPILWSSKLQSVPALSTCEAEWYSVDYLFKDLLWIRQMIKDIGFALNSTTIFCDNQPTIRILNNEHLTSKTRHVDRTFYHIKHYLANGSFTLQHIPTDHQTADILTKPLSAEKHYFFLSELSIFDSLNCSNL